MDTKNALTIIAQSVDLIADEMKGQPLLIERSNGEDMILVSNATYNGLLQRIEDLEAATTSPEEKAADEAEMLSMLTSGKD